ncbi:ADP-ribosylglycohydrolase family protein [Streptomyces sp. NPDC093544]|uniref:ADP-ribosylglycohydrolase family protein n=1 Tax=Streptomyces sp. NPDC093544 TaxID=3155200 RepID=UPI00343DE16B
MTSEARSARKMPVTSSFERVYGALIGHAVGDALGAPTEGLTRAQIVERHGWVSDFVAAAPASQSWQEVMEAALAAAGLPAGLRPDVCRAGGPAAAPAQRQRSSPTPSPPAAGPLTSAMASDRYAPTRVGTYVHPGAQWVSATPGTAERSPARNVPGDRNSAAPERCP